MRNQNLVQDPLQREILEENRQRVKKDFIFGFAVGAVAHELVGPIAGLILAFAVFKATEVQDHVLRGRLMVGSVGIASGMFCSMLFSEHIAKAFKATMFGDSASLPSPPKTFF